MSGRSGLYYFRHNHMGWLGLVLVILCLGMVFEAGAEELPKEVYVLTAQGSINPGMAGYILEGLQSAEKAKADALVIELDTPGGLDTSMRQIVQGIINASIPVIVYVYPKGARAASAGMIVTLSAHIAAMAPGTNIGAAHPVSIGTKEMDKVMSAKVVNDMAAYVRSLAAERNRNADWAEKAVRQSVSIPAAEALKLKVVDVIADDLPELLKKIDGLQVRLNQGLRSLKTAKAKVIPIEEGFQHKILRRLADPNIAMILMMIGLAGLYFELAHPGAIFPGVLGGICLLLAFYAFQTLPVNFIGILLIVLAFIFFLLEIYVTSYGMLAVAGIISLALGGLMLYRVEGSGMQVSWSVLVTTIAAVGAFFLLVTSLAVRAQMRKPLTGKIGMIGERGMALSDLNPAGKVMVHGTYWDARAEEFIATHEQVEVVGVENLQLIVRPVSKPQ